jgi:uncharacterized protein YpmS
MNNTRKLMIVLALAALFATSLACKAAQNLTQPTPIPTKTPQPASSQAVGELVTQVAAAASTVAAGGTMTLEVTEQQLTSAALLAIQTQSDTPISNLQILLRDGQLKVTGSVSQSGFDLPLVVVMQITADANGHIQTKVISADVGFFSLPQSMVDQVSTQVNQMLLSQFNTTADAIFVESIVIADGKMTITAHKR